MTHEEKLAANRARRKERMETDPAFRERELEYRRKYNAARRSDPILREREYEWHREYLRKRYREDVEYRVRVMAQSRNRQRTPEVRKHELEMQKDRLRHWKQNDPVAWDRYLGNSRRWRKKARKDPNKRPGILAHDQLRHRKLQQAKTLARFAQIAAKLEAKR